MFSAPGMSTSAPVRSAPAASAAEKPAELGLAEDDGSKLRELSLQRLIVGRFRVDEHVRLQAELVARPMLNRNEVVLRSDDLCRLLVGEPDHALDPRPAGVGVAAEIALVESAFAHRRAAGEREDADDERGSRKCGFRKSAV